MVFGKKSKYLYSTVKNTTHSYVNHQNY